MALPTAYNDSNTTQLMQKCILHFLKSADRDILNFLSNVCRAPNECAIFSDFSRIYRLIVWVSVDFARWTRRRLKKDDLDILSCEYCGIRCYVRIFDECTYYYR